MRVMAAADFGNGLSGVLDYFKYIYINPDLTVYLHRQPVGEWVCLDAATEATAWVSPRAGSGIVTVPSADLYRPYLSTSAQPDCILSSSCHF